MLNYQSVIERSSRYMEDTIIKPKDQTIWYENDELIKQYLVSAKNMAKLKAVTSREKPSLVKLIKEAMADQTE